MLPSTAPSASLAREDLATLAQVAMLRFPLRAAESRRLERMRVLLAASAELGRALNAYTHCGLVNCQGSHGVGSLGTEGEAFYTAFVQYADLMRETAAEFRRFTDEGPAAAVALVGSEPQLEVA
ncbi:MAG: hypothetical protein ACXWZS_07035 [Gemmatirosa sp.]